MYKSAEGTTESWLGMTLFVSRKSLVSMLPSGRLVIWNLTVGNLNSIALLTFMSSTVTFKTPFFCFHWRVPQRSLKLLRSAQAHMGSLRQDAHITCPVYQLKHWSLSSPWTAGYRTGWMLGTVLFTTTLGKYQLGRNLIFRNSILITTGGKRDKRHPIFFTNF